MWLSLLRGINVGGHKKIKMAELKALYTALGFTEVHAYIQSGNLIFSAREREPGEIISQIQNAIVQNYAFEVNVLLRQASDLHALCQDKPRQFDDLKSIYVCFLSQAFHADDLLALQSFCTQGELIQTHGQELYLYYPKGYGKSKLNNSTIERCLNTVATTRNWNTILHLKALFLERFK